MKTFFPLSKIGRPRAPLGGTPKITDAVRILEQTLARSEAAQAFRQAQAELLRKQNTIRPCPMPDCIAGERDNVQNTGGVVGHWFPKCPVCLGTGFVDLAHTCCCGNPAVLLHEGDGVLYCGRELCRNSLRRRTGMGA